MDCILGKSGTHYLLLTCAIRFYSLHGYLEELIV